MSVISVSNLKKEFPLSNGLIQLFDNLSFDVEENEFLVILGKNGSGKTTLLNLIAGFEKPTEGQILVNGVHVEKSVGSVGFIFQEDSLFPWKTVFNNVLIGLDINNFEKKEARLLVNHYLSLLGLSDFCNIYPYQLSAGMRQKVVIARALVVDPKILLMDEPLSNLDIYTKKMLQDELIRLWKRTKKTILYVTHTIEEALFLATRIIVLKREGFEKEIIKIKYAHPLNISSPYFQRIYKKISNILQ